MGGRVGELSLMHAFCLCELAFVFVDCWDQKLWISLSIINDGNNMLEV